MRKALQIVAAVILALGCTNCDQIIPGPKSFSTKDGLVELRFPAGWFFNEKENPFDLQCFSKDESLNTGIFLFRMQDMAEGTTPQQLLRLQVADMQSKRQGFYSVESQTIGHENGKTLTTEVYCGEKDLSKYFYRFTLIEFSEYPDIVLVALQVAFPSSWDKDKLILEGITKSARIKS